MLEWRRSDLLDIFETIKILTSTLDYPLFEELRRENSKRRSDEIFICGGRGVRVKGEYAEEGMVVIKGSQMSIDTTDSYLSKTLRESLIKDGIVRPSGECRDNELL